ncbi:PepSY domain-containing protein [Mesorhizobium retamae]|uniref:PepSY domain-containing protein n=1 Tax=Mesorhizobium retamae TaxID=2912854 RepID=A0ABS9QQK3_9HYPH|nr:PepSY domain-containing protein [Mesorhizobium sp. IRAMC:0171]MCG7508986.1 PepSY domain-containing protein [Mesorhizobium sp. IRAMC:0171]
MIKSIRMLALGSALAAVIASPALADRKPTLEERARIEGQLKSLGYTSWDEIEFDIKRNHWEIDDALAGDGKYYDLKLAPETLDVVSRKLDD